mmetsp:Transcript_52298/g.168441  ORF Transcript_52298/g.168441 Transcript_52298/m.168441 type:complete len:274 (+) Transcript_52298:426-1247(+)
MCRGSRDHRRLVRDDRRPPAPTGGRSGRSPSRAGRSARPPRPTRGPPRRRCGPGRCGPRRPRSSPCPGPCWNSVLRRRRWRRRLGRPTRGLPRRRCGPGRCGPRRPRSSPCPGPCWNSVLRWRHWRRRLGRWRSPPPRHPRPRHPRPRAAPEPEAWAAASSAWSGPPRGQRSTPQGGGVDGGSAARHCRVWFTPGWTSTASSPASPPSTAASTSRTSRRSRLRPSPRPSHQQRRSATTCWHRLQARRTWKTEPPNSLPSRSGKTLACRMRRPR